MKYTVIRIEEDLDFGCEERLASTPLMAIVTIKDETGAEMQLRQPDQMLYGKKYGTGWTAWRKIELL